MKLNSKERVKLAIEHVQPDRVPLDFSARAQVHKQLQSHFNVSSDEDMYRCLDVDLRYIGPAYIGFQEKVTYADPSISVDTQGIYKDIWGVGFKVADTQNGQYVELAEHPLKCADSAEDIEVYNWPSAQLWDYSTIADKAKYNQNYWVWAHSRGIFEVSWFLRGLDNFLMDLIIEPQRACLIMDRVQDYLFNRTRSILQAGNGLIDMIEYNDDVGGQNGLLISPQLWRAHLKPRMAAFIQMCREFNVKVRYHSCGSVREIIGDLIEIGVDVLNPVQSMATGMDPVCLKQEFGDQITFNGGIDTQELLPNASPEKVMQETHQLMEVMNRQGGYILAPSHVFQPDVSLANILAVYNSVKQ